jgi:hypothetical protein
MDRVTTEETLLAASQRVDSSQSCARGPKFVRTRRARELDETQTAELAEEKVADGRPIVVLA